LIQDLPNRYRLVFNLYELDDFSHAEIAKMLSISIGTSKSNLHRAKLLLKEKIEKLKSPSNKLLENHGN
ncbi:MAG TPA: RNA polymerase sigma factor, partial [Mangrovimonas sp.]|nr:RNA polymerase sigma factor [Mangrovimonas sp.]